MYFPPILEPFYDRIKNGYNFVEDEDCLSLATGYFAKIKNYVKRGFTPVSVSALSPNWFSGAQYRKVAPSRNLLFRFKKKEISEDQYVSEYIRDVLSKLSCEDILKDLRSLVNSERIVLICYEKPFDFCHRHILSYWFRRQGFNVGELSKD